MLNENASNLKQHLKTLHADLASTGEVDAELKDLLRQLDGDIKTLLERRLAEDAGTDSSRNHHLRPGRTLAGNHRQVRRQASAPGAGPARAGQYPRQHGHLVSQGSDPGVSFEGLTPVRSRQRTGVRPPQSSTVV